jgi:uncharacterized repeat protein (TIGR01451 family)
MGGRRWRGVAGVVAAASLVAGTALLNVVTVAPAEAAAPTRVWYEDFENTANGTATVLTSYVGGTAANGATYSADYAYRDPSFCDGIILDSTTSPATATAIGCLPGQPSVPQAMANNSQVLGQHNGSVDPTRNGAIGYRTNNPGPNPNEIVVETTNAPIVLTTNRFYIIKANIEAENCFVDPVFEAYFVNPATGGQARTNTTALDPCTDPNAITDPPSGAGRHSFATLNSNQGYLAPGTTTNLRIRNQTGSGGGNDFSVDDLEVLDATPSLGKAFSPTTIQSGQTSRMTFTVTNTDDLASKNGFSFTDNLPTGMSIAATPNFASTCTTPSIPTGGTAGATSVSFRGSLTANQASCTFSIDVTATAEGTYVNAPTTNVTSLVGLNAPNAAQLVIQNPQASLHLTKRVSSIEDVNSNDVTDIGDRIHYEFVVENDGLQTMTGIAVNDPKIGAVTCPQTTLAPGASMTCTGDAPHTITQSDFDAHRFDNSATASGTDQAGNQVNSNASTTSTPIAGAAQIALRKRVSRIVDVNRDGRTDAGDKIYFEFEVTNTGSRAVKAVRVVDPKIGAVSCPSSQLQPSASVTCTGNSPHVVTKADANAGRYRNTATARADTLDGDTTVTSDDVVSNQSATSTPIRHSVPASHPKAGASLPDTGA